VGEHITDEEYNAAPREATGPQAGPGRVMALGTTQQPDEIDP
jgi:hypothetical protein